MWSMSRSAVYYNYLTCHPLTLTRLAVGKADPGRASKLPLSPFTTCPPCAPGSFATAKLFLGTTSCPIRTTPPGILGILGILVILPTVPVFTCILLSLKPLILAMTSAPNRMDADAFFLRPDEAERSAVMRVGVISEAADKGALRDLLLWVVRFGLGGLSFSWQSIPGHAKRDEQWDEGGRLNRKTYAAVRTHISAPFNPLNRAIPPCRLSHPAAPSGAMMNDRSIAVSAPVWGANCPPPAARGARAVWSLSRINGRGRTPIARARPAWRVGMVGVGGDGLVSGSSRFSGLAVSCLVERVMVLVWEAGATYNSSNGCGGGKDDTKLPLMYSLLVSTPSTPRSRNARASSLTNRRVTLQRALT